MDLFVVLNKGGWVAWCLAILSLLLWYCLAYRFLCLKSKILKISPRFLKTSDFSMSGDALVPFLKKSYEIEKSKPEDRELAMELVRVQLNEKIHSFKPLIKSIVVVAPLLGLLGTVIGMIETFESLQDSALFSQSGGIAGGISQALITTQMGLVVAIPGLLIGKRLDRKEEAIKAYLDQYIGVLALGGVKNEIKA